MAYASIAEAEARIAELESEAKSLTRESISHKKGYQGVKEFLESKGFDPKGDLEEQWGKVAGSKDELMKKVDRMQAQLDRAEKEKNEYAERETGLKIKSSLSEKMKDIIGSDELIDLWIAKKRVSMDEKGKIHYDDDGDTLSLDKAVENYRKSHPERISIKQSSGSGSVGSQAKEGSQKREVSTESTKIYHDEFQKLSKKEKTEFVNNGGVIEHDPDSLRRQIEAIVSNQAPDK